MSVTIDTPTSDQNFNRSQTVTISGGPPAPNEIKITYPDGMDHGGIKIKIDPVTMGWSASAGPFTDHGDYLIKAIGPGDRVTNRGFTVSAP